MALVLKDRVKETTITIGTSTLVLLGATSGFQSFSVIGDGNTTYYTIDGGTEWEVGIGTYTLLGTTLSRDTILESSNSGSAVNFSAGTKNVFVTYPAERALYTDASSNAIALGTPASATLTNATGLPIVAGTTGTLTVARGGTGAATLTGVIKGNGTSAFTAATSGTDYSAGTSALTTGIVKSTTTTGALSIAVAADFPTLNQNTTGSSASCTGNAATATTATNQSGGTVAATTGSFTGLITGASSASTNVNTANDTGSISIRGSGSTVATMSFHRTGAYAINMGLGTDNIFRIGGWSASNDCLKLTGVGNLTALGTMTAASFIPTSSSAPTNGLYLPAANTLSLSTNSTERMRIDSSGNVGIGTSSPDALLTVNTIASFGDGAVGTPSIAHKGDLNTGIFFSAADTIDFTEGGTACGQFDSSGNFKFNSGYGSVATAFGCRAWVNFNGTGTVAIRDSGNVSSITDNGTGNYTVNFTTAMPDTDYSVTANSNSGNATTQAGGVNIQTVSAGSVRIQIMRASNGGGTASTADSDPVCVNIVR
jgi:hypothetical protein